MDLSDVRILDLTRLLPGPYATQLLRDMGAEVIKVEQPGTGDYGRTMAAMGESGGGTFAAVNAGKRSITLDLKDDDAREAFLELAADADVVVEGFRPGVVDRLGVGFEAVREHNPEIVYCSLSGFGATGPLADRPGHDLNYQALAGTIDLTRAEEGGRPAIPGVPIADMAGGMAAAMSILGALLSRELGGNSGRKDGGGGDGTHLDIGLADVVLSFTQPVAPDAFAGEAPTARHTSLTGEFPCYDVYEAADGGYVTLAALEPPFFEAFCEAVDRPDLLEHHLSTDPAEREALRAELAEIFAEHTRREWEEVLGDEDAMFAPVNSLEEALGCDQVETRDLVVESGEWPRIGFPGLVDGDHPEAGEPDAPELGADTEDVLGEAGLSESEIRELAERDAI